MPAHQVHTHALRLTWAACIGATAAGCACTGSMLAQQRQMSSTLSPAHNHALNKRKYSRSGQQLQTLTTIDNASTGHANKSTLQPTVDSCRTTAIARKLACRPPLSTLCVSLSAPKQQKTGCAAGAPGGSDCLNFSALSLSATVRVYRYLAQRTCKHLVSLTL